MGDFDFLVGEWTVANRRLKERLTGCTEWKEFTSTSRCWNLFDGAANIDEFAFPDGTHGLTLRLFDRSAHEWSLSWSASGSGRLELPVVGRFQESAGTREGRFYGDEDHQGRMVRVRYIWSRITPASARWEQAFSTDGQQSWETNWVMDFTRCL